LYAEGNDITHSKVAGSSLARFAVFTSVPFVVLPFFTQTRRRSQFGKGGGFESRFSASLF